MKGERIAACANGLDPIWVPKKSRENLFLIVEKGGGLDEYSLKEWPETKIIRITKKESHEGRVVASLEKMIRRTDITERLHEKKIEAVIAPYWTSPELVRWATQENFFLLGTPYALQKKFENKGWFNQFLQNHAIPSPRSYTAKTIAKAPSGKKYVIQESKASEEFRTRFSSKKDAERALKKSGSGVLVREYVEGIPAGISVCLDSKGNCLISAIRRQCFLYKKGSPEKFLGIQWIPRDRLPTKTKKAIKGVVKKLVGALMGEGFYGVANIDFMISGGEVYVLECNPRFSLATPQIFRHPELSDEKNMWQFIINSYTEKRNGRTRKSALPESAFEGSTLVITAKKNTKNLRPLPVGPYVPDKKENDSILLLHELGNTKQLKKEELAYTALSSYPLFSQKTGKLNKKGIVLLKKLEKTLY